MIRAEVGDQIHVVFRNNAQFPFSISGSGVSHKASEGASYDDGTWLAGATILCLLSSP